MSRERTPGTECCQFLTPSLCFQKLRITSGFEFFFTTLAVDGTIQKSGKQLRERCPESKETLVAQRLWVCIFFVNERHFFATKSTENDVFGAFSYFLTYFEKAVFAENRLDNKLDNKLPEKLYFVEPNTLSSWVRSINFSRPVSSTPKKISTIFAIISSVAHFFCTDQIIGKTQMIPDVRR